MNMILIFNISIGFIGRNFGSEKIFTQKMWLCFLLVDDFGQVTLISAVSVLCGSIGF